MRVPQSTVDRDPTPRLTPGVRVRTAPLRRERRRNGSLRDPFAHHEQVAAYFDEDDPDTEERRLTARR